MLHFKKTINLKILKLNQKTQCPYIKHTDLCFLHCSDCKIMSLSFLFMPLIFSLFELGDPLGTCLKWRGGSIWKWMCSL